MGVSNKEGVQNGLPSPRHCWKQPDCITKPYSPSTFMLQLVKMSRTLVWLGCCNTLAYLLLGLKENSKTLAVIDRFCSLKPMTRSTINLTFLSHHHFSLKDWIFVAQSLACSCSTIKKKKRKQVQGNIMFHSGARKYAFCYVKLNLVAGHFKIKFHVIVPFFNACVVFC